MNFPSKRLGLLASVSLIFIPMLHAQQSASAEQLKAALAVRQDRVKLLRDEIKQSDVRIESRLDVILGALTAVTDSKNSKSKVTRIKEDTGKQLLKTITYYDQKRAALKEELRNPRLQLTREEKEKIIAIFDDRIEKRTNQIVALYRSMPAFEDHEPNRTVSDGWGNSYTVRNSDYDQARRMTTHTNQQRDAIVKQLDASLVRLDRQGRSLKEKLAATTDPAQRVELGQELAVNDALIAERRKQRANVLTSAGSEGRALSLNEAVDLDKALKTASKDLGQEFTMLFQRYNTLLNELSTLHATESALNAKTTH